MTSTIEKKAKKALQDGWATIGGRIEDYADTLHQKGIRAVREEIKASYGDNTEKVLNGLYVYLHLGVTAYYN